MRRTMARLCRMLCLAMLLVALVPFSGLTACTDTAKAWNSSSSVTTQSATGETASDPEKADDDLGNANVVEDGSYTNKDEVAAYIHEFGHLPPNFISKTKARAAGWVSEKGNLAEVCPGMSIGGGTFYNDDGILPNAEGRTWTECDINYVGGYRGAERLVFSNDGLIYYTADHYVTFERLY